MNKARIMIVDDEDAIVFTLKEVFKDYEIKAFTKPGEALESIRSGERYDILLIDFRMQGITGLDILFEAKQKLASYRAILITAFSNRELLEKVINNDLIYRIVNKPIKPDDIRKIVEEASIHLDSERKEKDYYSILENQMVSMISSSGRSKFVFVHSCRKMKELLETIKKYAKSNANILIEGESGVGKEVITNLLHEESPRSEKPLIKLNCSSIPEHLFESELFGYKKGAFTGANCDKPGKFQLANGGTLFLDEIGELPLHQQTKLLRAIEDLEISPLGSTVCEKVDVRIISATNKNLQEAVNRGEFRKDLLFRLNVLNLYIPSLKERRDDIPLLACYFLAEIANREGQISKKMDKEAMDYLSQLEFTGNVREFKNLIYRVFILTEDNMIRKEDIEEVVRGHIRRNDDFLENSMTLDELEKRYIQTQLEKNEYSLTETARVLGVEVSNLSRKLKGMGISVRSIKNQLAAV